MAKISDFLFRRKPDYLRRKIIEDLLRAQKQGLVDASSTEMIRNMLAFSTILAREIMIPRTDIIAVSLEAAPEEIIQQAVSSRHTRIPVYRGTIDNIVGILNIKDILRHYPEKITTPMLLRHLAKPYYIPETKNAALLFHEFKTQKKHIAIVIDEYGGTSGLLTLEDLLEEIVGDIRDEHESDEDTGAVSKTTDGAMIFDGRTELERIEEYLNISLERGRYETVSGWILSATRRIPHVGEQFRIGELDVTIESADERSIKKVKIKKNDQAEIHDE